MLAAIFACLAFADEMVVTTGNVNELVRRSHQIPVFLIVYSSHCGACRMVYPIWQKVMAQYSRISGIIIASVDVVTDRPAAQQLFKSPGYPSFLQLVAGVATEVSVNRTFEGFCARADQLRKRDVSQLCQLFSTDTPPVYPMLIISTPANQSKPCELVNAACTIGNSEPPHCFLSPTHSNGLSLTVVYGPDWAFTLSNLTTKSLRNLVFDYSREPFGGWDLKTSLTSERRLAILVFSEGYQLLDVKSIAKSQAKHFLMGRLTFADFEALVGHKIATSKDAPLLLVSDQARRKCVVWKNLGRNKKVIADLGLVREGKFDGQMTLRLDAIQGRSRVVWYGMGLGLLAVVARVGFVSFRRLRGGCQKQE
jgi:thiol-disulfide isomerase/thioredoxin